MNERQFNEWAAKYPENFEALADLIDKINTSKRELEELESRLIVLSQRFRLETRAMSDNL